MLDNPFTIISPEELDAELAQQLFVEVYSDFPQVKSPGHSMIIGARGSGKSMIFRCLLPDVLMLTNKTSFDDLEFVAFHIPIKNSALEITELKVLEKNHASVMLNEHFFILNVLMHIISSLGKIGKSNLIYDEKKYAIFLEVLNRKLRLQGCKTKCEITANNPEDFFNKLNEYIENIYGEFFSFLQRIMQCENKSNFSYNMPIFSYRGFVVPFLKELKKLPGFENKNFYLFIDDADNLNKCQTQILNSWIACRTTPTICLKVSTQIGNYKSYITPNGIAVEAPHDYQEINISEKYTTSKSKYFARVKCIVEKRLKLAEIENITPEEFFPEYKAQTDAIMKERQRLLDSWATEGRGNRPIDDANRYAIPNYIRDLGGTRKQRSSFMYAGFETLVHLSSGVIRLFLDSAATMFDLAKSENPESKITTISYSIQNKVARDKADEFLYTQFRRIKTDEPSIGDDLSDVQKLQNLIMSMGKTFHDILIDSKKSERRVFSIALSNTPTKEMTSVLDLGVQYGYLHRSYIGTKDGAGRTWLFILNRYLAPEFTLDPTSFAGYLFLKNENIINAMKTGEKLKPEYNEDNMQLSLFDDNFEGEDDNNE